MSKTRKSILIACVIMLVIVLPAWLCIYKISQGDKFIISDPDSLLYYRIVDQAYHKGSEKYLDYDNYGNFPFLFKIGYPRFYYWLLYFSKILCTKIFPYNADFLMGLLPVITTTLTALLIIISFCFLGYPPVFLLFAAFLLLPNSSAFSVGSFAKLDYDHILSLYVWVWVLCSMFYQDSEKKIWLYLGGIASALLFGSWIGSLLLFFVVTVVCVLLWCFNSNLCKKYLPYCSITFGIAAVVNTLVVLISPGRYGTALLDFGIIHISAIFLAALGIFILTKFNPSNKSKIIFFSIGAVIILLFAIIDPADTKDLVERVSGTDPIFLEINELQPLIEIKKLFVNKISVEKAVLNYNLFIFLFPLFIFISAKKLLKKESASILQLWLIIVAFASFYQNRYIRIFGIGNCLFAAFILYFLWKSLSGYIEKAKLSKARVFVIFILLLLTIRASALWGLSSFSNSIRNSELAAFDWIKKNTPPTSGYYDNKKPEYGILAYWDFGHLINFYTHRPVIANNMQNGVKNMADIFSSKDEETAYRLCRELRVKYIFMEPDRMLFPSTIDYWPAYKNQKRAPGYRALPYNVERSKDYDKWFFTWLNKWFGLRSIGNFEASSNFRIVYANAESNSPSFSTMFFEIVPGAKLVLQAKPETTANVSLTIRIGRKLLKYQKEKKVEENGLVSFLLPYSCSFNNGVVASIEFYDVSFVSHETNQKVVGKVSVKEADVIAGNTVATSSIFIFR